MAITGISGNQESSAVPWIIAGVVVGTVSLATGGVLIYKRHSRKKGDTPKSSSLKTDHVTFEHPLGARQVPGRETMQKAGVMPAVKPALKRHSSPGKQKKVRFAEPLVNGFVENRM
jgi:hypothetical protein